ncbi:MAG: 1,4-dihydroxy-2-naphthoate octaprenyltransferase [Desulfobacteraceae bacterium]|nr:MAG: 1,4-dihydroxy-2-naphthoate octaprenyltransferase [Desulfobacteraceae bacterium]
MIRMYKTWFLASRPWSFTMSWISVSVGAALAALDGPFSWTLYLLTLLGTILIHAATNLINDYYDVRSGVDKRDVSTARYRPHPLIEGTLTLKGVRNAAWVLYVLAAGIGFYLALQRGWAILGLALAGAFFSLTYTAPPLKYKYRALGEIGVFFMWGPVIVEGAYFVQQQVFSLAALWVSLPFGTLVALVLLANNLRDVKHDGREGIATLPMLLGKRQGRILYLGLIVLAYLAVVVMSVLGPLALWSLIVLVSLPTAFKLFKTVARELPIDADARTAQLDTVFGVLLVISIVLNRMV